MTSLKLWVVICVVTVGILSMVTADSDPGYSRYGYSHGNHNRGHYRGRATGLAKPYHNPYYRSLGESYRSLPSRRDSHNGYSSYNSYDKSRYYNKHHKYHKTRPHFGYHPKPGSYPNHVEVPEPAPHPIPHPHPVPHPHPHPVPHPVPHPHPISQPHPLPHPHPHPVPHPQPHPQPLPIPHPEPHPHPHPEPHPVPYPEPHPSPHPQPFPVPHPEPLPTPQPAPQPHPIPQPTPIPQPFPAPIPHPVPIVPVPVPHPVEPIPAIEEPDIDIISTVDIPTGPIETIGRPPVAPSVQPPAFIAFQRSVPGFVDIQRVIVQPHGEPVIVEQPFLPNVPLPVQFQNAFPFHDSNVIEVEPELIEEVRGPVQPAIPAIQPAAVSPFPTLSTIPVQQTSILQPVPAVPQSQLNFAQNLTPNPLLSRAVPAVPSAFVPAQIPNPRQPVFNISPATARATALLLQAASLGPAVRNPSEISTPADTQLLPQAPQLVSVPSQFDFNRLPNVILPDPVPAVPQA